MLINENPKSGFRVCCITDFNDDQKRQSVPLTWIFFNSLRYSQLCCGWAHISVAVCNTEYIVILTIARSHGEEILLAICHWHWLHQAFPVSPISTWLFSTVDMSVPVQSSLTSLKHHPSSFKKTKHIVYIYVYYI